MDILGDLTSTYNRHDFVLVHVAEEIQKDVISFGSLLTANRGQRVGSYDRSILSLNSNISLLVSVLEISAVSGMTQVSYCVDGDGFRQWAFLPYRGW